MPYDATDFQIVPATVDPLTLTTPRERLEYLRDFLRVLPPERFDMSEARVVDRGCGTVACIGGWAKVLFGLSGFLSEVGAGLGLTEQKADELFIWVTGHRYVDVTPQMAALVIDNAIRTGRERKAGWRPGKIDWSAADASA
jgi:hypothetical protein